jgi:hypothetical protein
MHRIWGVKRHAAAETAGRHRCAKTLASAIAMPAAKINVPITNTCSGMPTLTAPYTHSGKVGVWPATKLVMMKSSIDSAKASSAAARMPGKISGEGSS